MKRREFLASTIATTSIGLLSPLSFADPGPVCTWDLGEQKRIIDLFNKREFYPGIFSRIQGIKGLLWMVGSSIFPKCMQLNYPNDLGIIKGSVTIAPYYAGKPAEVWIDTAEGVHKLMGSGILKENISKFQVQDEKLFPKFTYEFYDLIINNLVWDHKSFWKNRKPNDNLVMPQVDFHIHGTLERPPLELCKSIMMA